MSHSATASRKQATANRLLHTRPNQSPEMPGLKTTMCPMTLRCVSQACSHHRNTANTYSLVRRLRRGSNSPDPHAIHSQGLRDPDPANPPHDSSELDQLFLGTVQEMDPDQPVDDVGQLVRRNWLHAAHLLEAQELREYTFKTTL